MSIDLRNKNRYGKFKANSNLGEVIVDISILGWGERIKVIQNKKEICNIDTSNCFDDEEENNDYDAIYDEDENDIYISDFNDYGTTLKISKPFLRCLKRYT